MTKIVPIRLTFAEVEMLRFMLASDLCEAENRSEWFRLLLHREWNKRKNLGVPIPAQYQTAFRVNGSTTLPLFGKQKFPVTAVSNATSPLVHVRRNRGRNSLSAFVMRAMNAEPKNEARKTKPKVSKNATESNCYQ